MKISAFYENILEGVTFYSLDMKETLIQLKRDGLEKLYFSYDTLKNDKDASILHMLQELGMGAEGLYGFFQFEHFPMDEEYKNFIDTAVKYHAGNVLLVPGFVTEEEIEKAEELKTNMWMGLKNAVQYGHEKGMDVSIEDFDGLTAPYCSIAGVREFLEKVPGLQFSFDTGNFVMYHDNELEAFELLKDKICTVHLKDRSHNKNSEKHPAVTCADGELLYAVPVGDGFMQIKEIMTRLKEMGYDGGLIAELYGYYPEDMLAGIRKSVKWIRETWDRI